MYEEQGIKDIIRLEHARKGLDNIRQASLYMIIGNILVGLGLVYLMFSMLLSSISLFSIHGSREVFSSVITIFTSIALVIVGAIILLIGIYGKLLPGAKALTQYKPSEYSTPESLIRIGFLWGMILLLIGVLLLFVGIGVFLVIVASILLLIGGIGLIILFFRLHSDFNESNFMVAGILFIIGLFIPFADLIGWILAYLGCNSAIRKIEDKKKTLGIEIKGREESLGELI